MIFWMLWSSWLSAFGGELNLQPGDVLFQSQPCYLCRLIELEEDFPVSHVGVLVQEPQGGWAVIEAWGKVQKIPINQFLSRRTRNTPTWVRRPRLVQAGALLNAQLLKRFETQFDTLNYDADFLWNNSDERGERLYCSELVVKFLFPWWVQHPQTKPMTYQRNREAWIRYFKKQPPDGLPGVSPADLIRSSQLITIGEIAPEKGLGKIDFVLKRI